jgi:hypothetical protein
MKPQVDRAKEGRANAKGIRCLYLATSVNNAIAEVRPWIGSFVSVGEFRLTRTVQLVDCTLEQGVDAKQPWPNINHAFSLPVTESDDVADYASTQILAEQFRDAGFDGVMYTSQFDDDSVEGQSQKGKNIVLFDVQNADLVTCRLRTVHSMRLESRDLNESYDVDSFI